MPSGASTPSLTMESDATDERRQRRALMKKTAQFRRREASNPLLLLPRASVIADAGCAAGPKARRWPVPAPESGECPLERVGDAGEVGADARADRGDQEERDD